MYARSTTVRGNPQAMDDGITYVRDKVMPAVRQMDGCVGLSMLADRESGRCIVTTAWADAEALRRERRRRHGHAAARRGDHGRPGRRAGVGDRAACTGCTAPTTAPAPASSGPRGTPLSSTGMIDAFRMSVLPQLEELPGFCSVSVMIDRDQRPRGRHDDLRQPQDMERGQGRAMALRAGVHPADGPDGHRGRRVRARRSPTCGYPRRSDRRRSGRARAGARPDALRTRRPGAACTAPPARRSPRR